MSTTFEYKAPWCPGPQQFDNFPPWMWQSYPEIGLTGPTKLELILKFLYFPICSKLYIIRCNKQLLPFYNFPTNQTLVNIRVLCNLTSPAFLVLCCGRSLPPFRRLNSLSPFWRYRPLFGSTITASLGWIAVGIADNFAGFKIIITRSPQLLTFPRFSRWYARGSGGGSVVQGRMPFLAASGGVRFLVAGVSVIRIGIVFGVVSIRIFCFLLNFSLNSILNEIIIVIRINFT